MTLTLGPKDNAPRQLRTLTGAKPEVLSVEWTHRHYVKDDEYVSHGGDIEAFLEREVARPIIRWADSPQLGYEILPNKCFYGYQPTSCEGLARRVLDDWKRQSATCRGVHR